MFAPDLVIKNKVKDVFVGSEEGWSHPVDIDVTTHTVDKKGNHAPNPEYEGRFSVSVSCDENCDCVAFDYKLLDHASYWFD